MSANYLPASSIKNVEIHDYLHEKGTDNRTIEHRRLIGSLETTGKLEKYRHLDRCEKIVRQLQACTKLSSARKC
jgi:hypothetical protein